MKILSLMLIVFLLSFTLFSQTEDSIEPSENITFEHIDKINGLSNNSVTCILQDSKGFMWFGTKDGLNKYDGYKFTIFKHDDNDKNSIRHNVILAIYEDSSNNIWIGTRDKFTKSKIKGSLNKYTHETEKFVTFVNNHSDPTSLSSGFVSAICEDDFGNLIIGTSSGLSKYLKNENKFISITINENDKTGLSNRINVIKKIRNEKSSEYWVGTDNGLIRLDEKLKTVSIYTQNFQNPFGLSMRDILAINNSNNGNLLIGTNGGGLNVLDINTKKFKRYMNNSSNKNSLSENRVNSVYMDKSNTLWIGTFKGLNKFSSDKGRIYKYQHNRSIPYSISSDRITYIYEDKSGIIWVGTNDGGINKINKQNNQFTHYTHNKTNRFSIISNVISSIYQDNNGSIWIATIKGLEKFDTKKERFVHVYPKKGIRGNKIWTFGEDITGNLWLGSFGNGLKRLNVKTNQIKHYKNIPNNPNSLVNNYVRVIYRDKKNIFWIGTHGGLNKFDPSKELFVQYKHSDKNDQSLSNNKVIAIKETVFNGKSELWIGTQMGGLNRFDPETEQFEHFVHEPDNINSLSNKNVWEIYEDKFGLLWISTLGGLNRFQREKNNFKRYQFDSDTIANDINKVFFEDASDNLWIGNNNGVYKYDRELDRFISYTEKLDLPYIRIDAILQDNLGNLWLSGERSLIKFNPISEKQNIYKLPYNLGNYIKVNNLFLKTYSGSFLIGGQNGLMYFNPEDIQDNKTIPNIAITDFQIFNKSVKIKNNEIVANDDVIYLDKHISETEEIKIPYDKDVFSIEFSALDFRDPDKNKYAYKLEGVDPDWVYTDASRRFATYNQLNPGEYTFHVKGTNNDGIWNEKSKTLKIVITPLWWQTIWFRFFAIVLIFGVVVYIFYNRIHALKRKQLQQEEFSKQLIDSQESERKRIASALHDSHGQNLLVISNEVQYFVNEHKNYEEDLKPVTKIVQESIDEIRTISYDLHPHQLDKLGLVKTIKSMINKVSASSDIKFNLHIDNVDDIFDKKIEINIYRILQEATNNIIKHSNASTVSLKIGKELNHIFIEIADNGKGFNKKEILHASSGLGLSGMQERVKIIKGKFKIESEFGKGVIIKIAIPFAA